MKAPAHWDQQREVPGRDQADDAHRLLGRSCPAASPRLLKLSPCSRRAAPAPVLEARDAMVDLAHGLRDGLLRFPAFPIGRFLAPLAQDIGRARSRTARRPGARQARPAPGPRRPAAGGGDGGVQVDRLPDQDARHRHAMGGGRMPVSISAPAAIHSRGRNPIHASISCSSGSSRRKAIFRTMEE